MRQQKTLIGALILSIIAYFLLCAGIVNARPVETNENNLTQYSKRIENDS